MTQTQHSNERTLSLLNALLEAQTESQVHVLLEKAGMLEEAFWLPYGGVPNNSGTFLSQQADARGALVEKIVNSIDAVLMRHAYERGDIQSGDLPSSMFAATERYFGVHDGKLHNLPRSQRSQLASQSVQVLFSGERANPTITIVDRGEGQAPQRFPDTFLSLSADNKRTIPFVQGKFNMGSAGAVPFCGREHHYQLILSRRHSAAPGADGQWGFTVVRRRPPDETEKTSVFQYLAPDGHVLSLHAGELPLWTRGATQEWIGSGSLIRLYEYDIPDRGSARLDFSHMLNRRLYRLPVPLQVIERRYPGREGPATVSGMEALLVDPEADMVEEGWPQGGEIAIRDIGKVRLTLVPFEPTAAKRWLRASESVIFTINGQAHAFESRQFLSSAAQGRPNLPWLASTLLVEVDCSDFHPRVVEQLFMSSRDRMRDNAQRKALLEAVGEYLRSHGGLRAFNDRRRQEAVRREGNSDPHTEELFGRLSSEITKFLHGSSNHRGGKNGRHRDFTGQRFPTYLRWTNRGDGESIEKHCPANGGCTIDLSTDAENSFLTRPDAPGICIVDPEDWFVSDALTDGELKVRLKAPEGAVVGAKIPLAVRLLSDDALVSELVAEGHLVVDSPSSKSGGGGGGTREPRKRKAGTNTPKITHVYQGDDIWKALGFTEHTVAKVENGAKQTTAYVNMDNSSLNRYRRGQPRRAEEINRVYSLAAAAMSVATDTALKDDKVEIEPEAAEQVLGFVGRVLAPTLDFVNQHAFAEPEDVPL